MSKTVYAQEGEWVVCKEGHRIAQFLETVFCFGEQHPDEQLGNWQQPPAEVGDHADTCVCIICGSQFYDDGGLFNFKEGLRNNFNTPHLTEEN